MKVAITKEDTLSGSEFKLVVIVWTQIGVASTPKIFEIVVVRFLMIQTF